MKIELTESQMRLLRDVIGSRLVKLSDNMSADAGTMWVKDYKAETKKLERIYDKLVK